MNDLPKMFDNYSEARKNGFLTIKRLKDEGKKVVGTFCTFAPSEVIYAAGLIPVSLCAKSDETIQNAERQLPRNLCPLIKSSYGFAITEKCPYFYFSDMIIGETTCDGKKKMFEYLGRIKDVHVMQLPQESTGEAAHTMWKNEIIRLKDVLEEKFHVNIMDEDIRSAIKLRNEERKMLLKLCSLGKLDPPPISGLQMLQFLSGSSFKWDKENEFKDIDNIVENASEIYENGKGGVKKGSKRILITGCPLGESTFKVVKAVEENGGVVVCYENCTGMKEIVDLVDETKEPYEALAEKYLKIGCSCMSPNVNRLKLLSSLIDDYKVDGVIDVILQACHTYSVETFAIREFVNSEKNVPYMSVETDYSNMDTEQLKTRIAAFIEML